MDPEAACDRIAARQHGMISRNQAAAAGLSRGGIERRVTSGRWDSVHRGVYLSRSTPRTWHQQLMAAVLFGGQEAYASHRSAGVLWRLDGIEGRPIEISRTNPRPSPGVIVHRRSPNERQEITVIRNIPVTRIGRTIIDLAGVLPEERLGLALDSALRRSLTSPPELHGRIQSMNRNGKPGLATLRRLLQQRDQKDSVAESRLESALLGLLRSGRLPLPVPQHPVEADGRTVARVDFAYPDLRLGIEVDGYRWHGGRESWARDMRRENRLKLLGWTLLRFSWEDVHARPEKVLQQIRAALSSFLLQFPTLSVGNRDEYGVSAAPAPRVH